jgi:hypothetical protein
MILCSAFRLIQLFCRLQIHLPQDDQELLDAFCWLPSEVKDSPAELFA